MSFQLLLRLEINWDNFSAQGYRWCTKVQYLSIFVRLRSSVSQYLFLSEKLSISVFSLKLSISVFSFQKLSISVFFLGRAAQYLSILSLQKLSISVSCLCKSSVSQYLVSPKAQYLSILSLQKLSISVSK